MCWVCASSLRLFFYEATVDPLQPDLAKSTTAGFCVGLPEQALLVNTMLLGSPLLLALVDCKHCMDWSCRGLRGDPSPRGSRLGDACGELSGFALLAKSSNFIVADLFEMRMLVCFLLGCSSAASGLESIEANDFKVSTERFILNAALTESCCGPMLCLRSSGSQATPSWPDPRLQAGTGRTFCFIWRTRSLSRRCRGVAVLRVLDSEVL